MNQNRQHHRSGFTLVEVAVVIFIMGIFVSFASTMLRNIGLSNKLRDARDKLATVSDAIQAATVKTRVLPSLASEVGDPNDYWSKKYKYYFYTPAAGTVADICRRSSTDLAVCTGDPTVAASPYKCTGNVIKDIAFVVISGGSNLVPEKTELIPDTKGCAPGLKCVPIYEVSSNFDDLYKYVTLQELKKTIGCVETDSGLRIITNDLPFANVSSTVFNTNTFNVEAAGGLPYVSNKYRWSKSGVLPNGLSFSPVFTNYTTTQNLRIVGMPLNSGTFNVTVTATDNSTVPVSTSKPFVITIKPK